MAKRYGDVDKDAIKFAESLRNGSIQLKDGQTYLQAYEEHLQSTSFSFKNLGKSALNGLKSFGATAINALGGMAISAGVSLIISGISEIAKTSKNVAEKANKLGSAFNETQSDINGYKEKIQELQATINDSGSSVEEVTSARKNLMTVQDELIEKFGDEKETINLITDAVNGQTKAFDKLTEKQWQATKNEFNDSGFFEGIGNWFDGYDTNIDRMVDEMENVQGRLMFSTDYYKDEKYSDLIEQIEKLGWSYDYAYGSFLKNGNLKELYSDILDIQKISEDYKTPEKFFKVLSEEANNAKETLDNYGDIWDSYILYDKILENKTLTNSWNEVNEAYNKYQKSITSGDTNTIDEATASFAKSLNVVLNDENIDDSVKDYFKDMYPTLTAETEKWEFKTTILPTFDTSSLKDKNQADILELLQTDFTSVISLAKTPEDVFNFSHQKNVFNSILESASEYGIITGDNTEKTQQLLDLLVEWGVLQEGIIKNTTFANTLDISSVSSKVTSFTTAQEALNTALSEQVSTGTISSETLAKLQQNYEGIENALEITTDGIILNTQKLSELTSAERENIETDLANKEKELTQQFNQSSIELEAYKSILENTSSTDEEYLQSLQNLISEKENDKNATRLQLDELKALQLEYENATSKHNLFIQSLSSDDEGSMYDDIVSGLEQVQKEWDAGNIGKDEIRNFVDYMSYDDMSAASIEEITAAYEEAMQKAQMYFTEGSEGSQRFLELLEQTEVAGRKLAEQDNEGNWNIYIDDLNEAAQELGISTEFLQDNLNKLKDKGFTIEFESSNENLQDVSIILETLDEQIDNLKFRLDHGDTTEGLREELEVLENQKIELEAQMDTSEVENAINTILFIRERLNAEGVSSSAQIAMEQAQQQIASQNGLDLQSVLGIDADDATEKFNLLKETIENTDITSTVTIDANRSNFDNTISSIQNTPYKAYIDIEVRKKNALISNENVVNNSTARTTSQKGTAAGGTPIGGISEANGTVGNAFFGGSSYNGLSKNEKKALRSEYGQKELTVYPNGRYEITETPTISDLPKGTVIFNEEQTNRILKGGSYKGTAGMAFYSSKSNALIHGGTNNTDIHGSGNSQFLNSGKNSNNNTASTTASYKQNSETKDKESDFSKIFDWIERRLNKLTTQTERWAAIIENATDAKRLNTYYKKLQSGYSSLAKTKYFIFIQRK